jgi:hypothetical protein
MPQKPFLINLHPQKHVAFECLARLNKIKKKQHSFYVKEKKIKYTRRNIKGN